MRKPGSANTVPEISIVPVPGGAFKTRAAKLAKLVLAAEKDTKVLINDDSFLVEVNKKGAKKPRTGCFEVKANGAAVLSLTGLKRPFPKLKALDIEALADKVVAALK